MSGHETKFICRNCHTPFINDTSHSTVDIQVLRSNHLPSPLETIQTRAILELELSELEQVEEAFEFLQKRRDTLRQNIARRRSWVAPIRRLPVEVLGEILSHTCLGDRPEESSLSISSVDGGGRRQCPLKCEEWPCDERVILKKISATTCSLSDVCHRWKNIILDSPHLWSSLHLDVLQMREKHADLVDLYLTRSAPYPLQIHIYDFPKFIDVDAYESTHWTIRTLGQTGFDVFCSVIAQLHRCRKFTFHFRADNLIGFVPDSFLPKELPLLTSFSHDTDFCDLYGSEWFWELLEDSPNLSTVSITKTSGIGYLPSSLRILKVKEPDDYSELLTSLRCLPNLTSLHLHHVELGSVPNSSFTLYFANIRDFTISTRGRLLNLEALFTFLTLPALTSLKIFTCQRFFDDERHLTAQYAGTTFYRSNQLAALRGLIERSACSLQELMLYTEPFSSNDLISLLATQPSLVNLTLEIRTPSPSSILADLCSRMSEQGQTPLIPRLRGLDLHSDSFSNGHIEYELAHTFQQIACVVDMLESREARSEDVQDVSLSFNHIYPKADCTRHDLPDDLAGRIRAMEARGIRCCVTLPVKLE